MGQDWNAGKLGIHIAVVHERFARKRQSRTTDGGMGVLKGVHEGVGGIDLESVATNPKLYVDARIAG